MNQWREPKIITAAISGLAMVSIVTVASDIRQAIALPSATVNQMIKQSTARTINAYSGSGVIFAKNNDGYLVLTNQHVVANSGDYQVTTADGRFYPVKDVREL